MSLAEQSQQWFPTSVQVTVHQARGLRSKGKNGTNDAYAIMQVAKDKFSTSVAEKSVAPVWKEEAAFDLPLFHPGNAERCTLQVCVMHRALMGPDKMLGQATINLLELQDNKSRNKTEWFKLMGKTGKADKDRGEVLLDIQFMKNNMTASMYDLSGQDKSRSRLGKIKDKLKGKKKDGMSDSASAIVPSVSHVLTDSEGEEEPDATPGAKKKNKLKSLFAPKPGLHRNMSQSMSTLATLPEKDSAISLSRSSGLNIESPEGKKKFKFLKHKRTGSSDSKVSQGTGSLGLGMVQSNTCINGSHVYTEESDTRGSRAGSTFSLNSSGHGSMEDLRRGHHRKTSSTSVDSSDQTQENAVEEMRRSQEEQKKQEEKRRQAEEDERKQIEREEERKRLEREEEKRKIQKLEEERKKIEREEERKWMEREEEKRKLEKQEEDKRRRIEKEERTRLENEKLQKEKETRKLEMDRRRAEEERLLKEKEKMGAEEKRKLKEKADQERIRKEKEEIERQKKEKQQPEAKPRSTRLNMSKNASDEINSDRIPFTNPIEDPLLFDESSSNPFEQPTISQPEALSRSTKVSAVKPRPHAVKPLSTTDKQPDLRETQDASRSAKITDDLQVKMKAPEAKGTGPYSQLTHEELINLLEKQKQQLSQKDAKIGELEQYIDNLLVRVMEDSPNILMSLSLMKKSV
uniref:Rab11 family-interacting protein 1-like n=1 Tax=Cyprinus carpio carpio TaxID=630221 RepID=A0A8C1BNW0_CYPCA